MSDIKASVPPPTRSGFAALMTFAILLSACSKDEVAPTTIPDPPKVPAPTVHIVSPVAGVTLTGPTLSVKAATTNLTFAAPGAAVVAGQGHLHVTLDKASGTAYDALITSADSIVLAGPLSRGLHYVIVSAHRSDHGAYGIQDSVAFTVAPEKTGPSFLIRQPDEGDTVGTLVTIRLTPKNFRVAASGPVVDSSGHFHYSLDNGAVLELADTVINLSNLAPGPHAIRISVHKGDHTDYAAEKTLHFIVTANAPDFTILSPTAGQTVATSMTVKLSTLNFKVVALGTAVTPGEGNFRYAIDDQRFKTQAESVFTLNELTPGVHTLKLGLQDADRNPFSVEHSVAITVSAALPCFLIASPGNKDTVSMPAQVVLSPKNLKLVAPTAVVNPNEGHFTYAIDEGATRILADSLFTVDSLAAGPHTVRVTLQKNNGVNSGLEQRIRITVK